MQQLFKMFDSSWINNEIGVKGSLVTAEVRGLLDKQFTEGFSSALACYIFNPEPPFSKSITENANESSLLNTF